MKISLRLQSETELLTGAGRARLIEIPEPHHLVVNALPCTVHTL